MHRTGSSSRFSDEFFSHQSPSSSPAPATNSEQQLHPLLPTYSPESHLAKKEKIRLRSAESAVHVIPLLLVLCAVILDFFSSPVDMANKGDSLAVWFASKQAKYQFMKHQSEYRSS